VQHAQEARTSHRIPVAIVDLQVFVSERDFNQARKLLGSIPLVARPVVLLDNGSIDRTHP
jgi:hypothetical protein